MRFTDKGLVFQFDQHILLRRKSHSCYHPLSHRARLLCGQSASALRFGVALLSPLAFGHQYHSGGRRSQSGTQYRGPCFQCSDSIQGRLRRVRDSQCDGDRSRLYQFHGVTGHAAELSTRLCLRFVRHLRHSAVLCSGSRW